MTIGDQATLIAKGTCDLFYIKQSCCAPWAVLLQCPCCVSALSYILQEMMLWTCCYCCKRLVNTAQVSSLQVFHSIFFASTCYLTCRDYMGLGKASASMSDRSDDTAVPSISLAGLASPQTKEDAPSTPRSSPWRENPAFLPPGTSKAGSDPSASSQTAQLQRSAVSADLSDRLAGMSVVGSGFQRVRQVPGEAIDTSAVSQQADASGQGEEGSGPGNGVMSVTGRANALGRLKDRQQQGARKTADEDAVSKGTPAAKYYLQVPGKR